MKETVQVFARVRPCREEGVTVSVELLDNTVVVGKHAFPFNGVFSSAATNEDVFKRMARPLLEDFLTGKNCTILAYGQTGSGKTWSISGGAKYKQRGLIPRCITDIFTGLDKLKKETEAQIAAYEAAVTRKQAAEQGAAAAGGDGSARPAPLKLQPPSFKVTVSYCEIYNEQCYDLLDESHADKSIELWQKVVIQEGANGVIHLKNLRVYEASSEKDCLAMLFLGNLNRMTAETPMNHASSRSHCIFTVSLEAEVPVFRPAEAAAEAGSAEKAAVFSGWEGLQLRHAGGAAAAAAAAAGPTASSPAAADLSDCSVVYVKRKSKLSLVDLAGSERIFKAGSSPVKGALAGGAASAAAPGGAGAGSSALSKIPSSFSSAITEADVLRKEGRYINLSLHHLEKVIRALQAASTGGMQGSGAEGIDEVTGAAGSSRQGRPSITGSIASHPSTSTAPMRTSRIGDRPRSSLGSAVSGTSSTGASPLRPAQPNSRRGRGESAGLESGSAGGASAAVAAIRKTSTTASAAAGRDSKGYTASLGRSSYAGGAGAGAAAASSAAMHKAPISTKAGMQDSSAAVQAGSKMKRAHSSSAIVGSRTAAAAGAGKAGGRLSEGSRPPAGIPAAAAAAAAAAALPAAGAIAPGRSAGSAASSRRSSWSSVGSAMSGPLGLHMMEDGRGAAARDAGGAAEDAAVTAKPASGRRSRSSAASVSSHKHSAYGGGGGPGSEISAPSASIAGQRGHYIPYRSSLLTSILRDSLGGNCRTVLLATLSPETAFCDESLSTCRFAARCGQVTGDVRVNEQLAGVLAAGAVAGSGGAAGGVAAAMAAANLTALSKENKMLKDRLAMLQEQLLNAAAGGQGAGSSSSSVATGLVSGHHLPFPSFSAASAALSHRAGAFSAASSPGSALTPLQAAHAGPYRAIMTGRVSLDSLLSAAGAAAGGQQRSSSLGVGSSASAYAGISSSTASSPSSLSSCSSELVLQPLPQKQRIALEMAFSDWVQSPAFTGTADVAPSPRQQPEQGGAVASRKISWVTPSTTQAPDGSGGAVSDSRPGKDPSHLEQLQMLSASIVIDTLPAAYEAILLFSRALKTSFEAAALAQVQAAQAAAEKDAIKQHAARAQRAAAQAAEEAAAWEGRHTQALEEYHSGLFALSEELAGAREEIARLQVALAEAESAAQLSISAVGAAQLRASTSTMVNPGAAREGLAQGEGEGSNAGLSVSLQGHLLAESTVSTSSISREVLRASRAFPSAVLPVQPMAAAAFAAPSSDGSSSSLSSSGSFSGPGPFSATILPGGFKAHLQQMAGNPAGLGETQALPLTVSIPPPASFAAPPPPLGRTEEGAAQQQSSSSASLTTTATTPSPLATSILSPQAKRNAIVSGALFLKTDRHGHKQLRFLWVDSGLSKLHWRKVGTPSALEAFASLLAPKASYLHCKDILAVEAGCSENAVPSSDPSVATAGAGAGAGSGAAPTASAPCDCCLTLSSRKRQLVLQVHLPGGTVNVSGKAAAGGASAAASVGAAVDCHYRNGLPPGAGSNSSPSSSLAASSASALSRSVSSITSTGSTSSNNAALVLSLRNKWLQALQWLIQQCAQQQQAAAPVPAHH